MSECVMCLCLCVHILCVCICASVSSCVCVPCERPCHNKRNRPHEKLLGIRRVSNPGSSIDPGSLKIGFLVLIQNAGIVRDNGTN